MELRIQAAGGGSGGTLAVADSVFAVEFNETLIHQVVTAYMAASRAGTKAQKNRSDVSGGGAKPFKQKGTGRARAGTIRSPLWRGGGVTFAARPRSYEQKVNRKMYRGALRSILSELARQDRLLAVEGLSIAAPKTKELIAKLKDLGVTQALIVTEGVDRNLLLAARNIPNIGVVEASEVDPVSLIRFDKVLMSEGALKKLEERLA